MMGIGLIKKHGGPQASHEGESMNKDSDGIRKKGGIFMQVRQRLYQLYCAIVLKEIVFKMVLIVIEYFQRVNETMKEFLLDAHEQTKINMFVKKLRLWSQFDLDFIGYFSETYALFVESRRRKILKDIDLLEDRKLEYCCKCKTKGLYEMSLPEIGLKLPVLETYYAFLKDDDVCQQRAFKEFLKKKIDDGDKRQEIADYLEDCHGEGFTYFMRGAYKIRLRDLWIEFFRSGPGYENLIPGEKPQVMYGQNADIPCFIFGKSGAEGFTKEEFEEKFTREWYDTHAYERDEEPLELRLAGDPDSPDVEAYNPELEDECQKAYDEYKRAVKKFKENKELFEAMTDVFGVYKNND